jgi:hypothetical protein
VRSADRWVGGKLNEHTLPVVSGYTAGGEIFTTWMSHISSSFPFPFSYVNSIQLWPRLAEELRNLTLETKTSGP